MVTIPDRRRLLEIGAVALTGIGKFIFVDLLPYKFWYITVAVIVWIIYIVVRKSMTQEILSYWGFSSHNFKKLFLVLLPVVIIITLAFVLYAYMHNTLTINWHILLILFIYPLWGTIQQFLMISLVAGNLRDLRSIHLNDVMIILITAVLFSSVHFPSLMLVMATFILALVYTPLFLKYRNVWPLGIYHGWLAGFFYFFVLNRDPWNEVFNTL